MRILHGVLLLLMLLFIGVQFNDPDGVFWAVVYSMSAQLLLIAVIWPQAYSKPLLNVLRWVYVVTLAVGVIYFWPKTPNFWRQDVWWETETAREGMGMMIACLAAASVFLVRAKR